MLKLIGICLGFHDYTKRFNLFVKDSSHSVIQSEVKTKTNRDSRAHIFPRFASATWIHFAFWLVHWTVCVLCDWLWLEWLLWFCFHTSQGFYWHFQQECNWFSHASKTFWTGFLHKKNFSVDCQTRQAKSFYQLVDLPGAWPSMKPPKT